MEIPDMMKRDEAKQLIADELIHHTVRRTIDGGLNVCKCDYPTVDEEEMAYHQADAVARLFYGPED